MDVSKVVPNHYKFGFFFLYLYLFNFIVIVFKLKIYCYCAKKVFEKTNSPPFLVRLLSHIESSIGIRARASYFVFKI